MNVVLKLLNDERRGLQEGAPVLVWFFRIPTFFFPEEFLVSNFTKFWCSGNMVLFNMLCVFFFYLKDNCFTVLCWFLPNINMNQP